MRSTVKSFEDLPVVLQRKDIEKVLGLSPVTVLKLMREPDFPVIRAGAKRLIVPRDKFLEWMERKSKEPTAAYK